MARCQHCGVPKAAIECGWTELSLAPCLLDPDPVYEATFRFDRQKVTFLVVMAALPMACVTLALWLA